MWLLPERKVNRLRLRAANAELVRHGAILVADALHTATLPHAPPEALWLVRSLSCGKIRRGQSAASVALQLERALWLRGADFIHATAPEAAHHETVYFNDALEACVALALRLARHESTEAWFWPLAVPAWQREMTRAEALRAVLIAALSRAPQALNGALFLTALHASHTLAHLLEALRRPEGPALLHLAGWSEPTFPAISETGRVTAREVAPLDASQLEALAPYASLLAHWVAVWGEQDARTLWLAASLMIAQRPAQVCHPQLTAQARALASHLAANPFGLGLDSLNSAPSQIDAAPHHHTLTKADVRSPSSTDPASDSFSETATSPAHIVTVRQRQPPLTRFAGIGFLLPVLVRLGLPAWLEQHPHLIENEIPQRILHRVVTRLSSPYADQEELRQDPVWQWLDATATVPMPLSGAFTPPPQWQAVAGTNAPSRLRRRTAPPLSDFEAMLDAWVTAARRWCRRYAGIGLCELVRRHGRLALTPTHCELIFDLSQVDLRIRRAGLDLDPGWLPWLGRVVKFHYQAGEALP